MRRIATYFVAAFAGAVLGLAIGAFVFHDVRPRAFIEAPPCVGTCLNASQIEGLLLSAAIHVAPHFVPDVVLQTDKAIAVKSPEPLAKIDYVIFPKKDITDLSDLSADDLGYIDASFEAMAELVRTNHLKEYKVLTNGPGFQQINYLHFHLLAQ